MIQLYLLEKLTHVAIFMNEYVKSHKQYFEQKRGNLENDIFHMTIYVKIKTQYFKDINGYINM